MKYIEWLVSAVVAFFEVSPAPEVIPTLLPTEETHVARLDGPWEVSPAVFPWHGQPVSACPVHPARQGAEGVVSDTVRYCMQFEVPAAWRKEDVFLCFDSLHATGMVRVNGHHVPLSMPMHNRHICFIGEHIRVDTINSVEIGYPHAAWAGMGIRPPLPSSVGVSGAVRLFHLPQTHLQNVTLHAEKDGTVTVGVAATGRRTRCIVYIKDADDHLIRRTYRLSFVPDSEIHTCQLQIPNPQFLRYGSPYPYTLQVDLFHNNRQVQTYSTRFSL